MSIRTLFEYETPPLGSRRGGDFFCVFSLVSSVYAASIHSAAILVYSDESSIPMHFLPVTFAPSAVVPLPSIGSKQRDERSAQFGAIVLALLSFWHAIYRKPRRFFLRGFLLSSEF